MNIVLPRLAVWFVFTVGRSSYTHIFFVWLLVFGAYACDRTTDRTIQPTDLLVIFKMEIYQSLVHVTPNNLLLVLSLIYSPNVYLCICSVCASERRGHIEIYDMNGEKVARPVVSACANNNNLCVSKLYEVKHSGTIPTRPFTRDKK